MPITRSIPFALLATVPLAYAWWDLALWLIAPIVFATFAILDIALGRDLGARAVARASVVHRWPLWLYIPAQLAVIVWAAATGTHAPNIGAFLGLALAAGATTGVFGMVAAHDMIHSRHAAERALGLALLAGMTYLHFRISHVHGHHRLAATPEDPATARTGESVYRFVARSVRGQLSQAWRYERSRVTARRWPLFANRVHRYAALTASIYAAVGMTLGGRAMLFQLAQSAVAIFMLELFNYVAHYGLVRRTLLDGRLEPLRAVHSWNATQRFNNGALSNCGHHSEHHRAPAAPSHELWTLPDAPMLPFGFAGGTAVALIPSLWRRVMDPRVAARMSTAASSRLSESNRDSARIR